MFLSNRRGGASWNGSLRGSGSGSIDSAGGGGGGGAAMRRDEGKYSVYCAAASGGQADNKVPKSVSSDNLIILNLALRASLGKGGGRRNGQDDCVPAGWNAILRPNCRVTRQLRVFVTRKR